MRDRSNTGSEYKRNLVQGPIGMPLLQNAHKKLVGLQAGFHAGGAGYLTQRSAAASSESRGATQWRCSPFSSLFQKGAVVLR